MQYPSLVINNWNGMYLNDCFRLIKPVHEDHEPGRIFEAKDHIIEGVSLGYARIALVSKIWFRDINDNLAFSIVNKPAPYLKTVLQRMYHLQEQHPVHVLTMQWTERNLEAHRAAVLCHWDHLVNTTPHGQSSPFKTINLPS